MFKLPKVNKTKQALLQRDTTNRVSKVIKKSPSVKPEYKKKVTVLVS